MPTYIRIPATARRIRDAHTKYRYDLVEQRLALGILVAWALSMLLIGGFDRFAAATASTNNFNLVPAF